MKWKTCFPKFHLLFAILLPLTLVQVGCNSDAPMGTESKMASTSAPSNKDWIRMKVTFKRGTDAARRDLTIRSIEKTLIDSINAWKEGLLPDYKPRITVTHDMFGDSLVYDIKAGDAPFGPPAAKPYAARLQALKDTIGNPTCTCKTLCGVCVMFTSATAGKDTIPVPGPGPNPLSNVASISMPE